MRALLLHLVFLSFFAISSAFADLSAADRQRIHNLKETPAAFLTEASANPQTVAGVWFQELMRDPTRLQRVLGDTSEPSDFRIFLLERLKYYFSQGRFPNGTAHEYMLAALGALRDTAEGSPVREHAHQIFQKDIWQKMQPLQRDTARRSLIQHATAADKRLYAVPALMLVDDNAGIARRLPELLVDTNVLVRRAGMRALASTRHREGRAMDGALQTIVATALLDTDEEVRKSAVAFLGEPEHYTRVERRRLLPEAGETVLRILNNQRAPTVSRIAASVVLGRDFGTTYFDGRATMDADDALEALRAAATDADPGFRLAAVNAFASIKTGDPDSQLVLVQRTFDEVDTIATKALAALGAYHPKTDEGRLQKQGLAAEPVKMAILELLANHPKRASWDKQGMRRTGLAEILRRNPPLSAATFLRLLEVTAAAPRVTAIDRAVHLKLQSAILATNARFLDYPDDDGAVFERIVQLRVQISTELAGRMEAHFVTLRPPAQMFAATLAKATGDERDALIRLYLSFSDKSSGGRKRSVLIAPGSDEAFAAVIRGDRTSARLLLSVWARKGILMTGLPNVVAAMLEQAAIPDPNPPAGTLAIPIAVRNILAAHTAPRKHFILEPLDTYRPARLALVALSEGSGDAAAAARALLQMVRSRPSRRCSAALDAEAVPVGAAAN